MAFQRIWLVLSSVLFVHESSLPQKVPGPTITVDEAKIAFHLFPETTLDVPLVNHTGHKLDGTLQVEMLGDDSNTVVGEQTTKFKIAPGEHVETLPWTLEDSRTHWPTFLGAYRLRYALAAGNDSTLASGIVQMGPHIVDGFDIESYPDDLSHCAMDCRFLVRVFEPNSGRALEGYHVTASFGPDGGPEVHAITDREGYAEIRFDLIPLRTLPAIGLRVMVSRGPFSTGSGGEIYLEVPPHLVLTTDKAAYRPGETVHMHLVLTGVDKLPWAGANVALRANNRWKEQELFSKKLVTDVNGEASEDWTIPESTEKSEVSIFAASLDEPQGNWTAASKVRFEIEGGDLPPLKFDAVADKPHYLPGQNAKITISATQLSGEPVRNGTVSVKTWWNPDGETKGKLDGEGKYVAPVDLKEYWRRHSSAERPDSPSPRVWPMQATITVTDATSGKSAGRLVDLKLARREIHFSIDNKWVEGSEKTLGIVSVYVDGSPAIVDGVVGAVVGNAKGECPAAPDEAHRIPLGRFHTNGFGVARFTLPHNWIEYAYPKRDDGVYSTYARVPRLDAPSEIGTKEACILLTAEDTRAKTGRLYQELLVSPEEAFVTRVSTNHSLYRPGEPIHVHIESDAGLKEAVVDIETSGYETVRVQHTRLANGRADVTFPYTPQFRGVLTVCVYAVTGLDNPVSNGAWWQEVIYPTGEPLKPGARWPTKESSPDSVQPDYPNSDAVEILGYEEPGHIAGFKKEDLLALDPSKPFPDGLDLVAWSLLGPIQSWGGSPGGYDNFRHEEFDKKNLTPIEWAIQVNYLHGNGYTKTEAAFLEAVKAAGVDFVSLRDGWGMPYRVIFNAKEVLIVSNGPDKLPNSKDDYVAARIR